MPLKLNQPATQRRLPGHNKIARSAQIETTAEDKMAAGKGTPLNLADYVTRQI